MKYYNKLGIKNRFIIMIIKYLYSTDLKQDFHPSTELFDGNGRGCHQFIESLHSVF